MNTNSLYITICEICGQELSLVNSRWVHLDDSLQCYVGKHRKAV